ncbi:MAG: hypothetical protein RL757_2745 [Bacteroidota bacterium]
MLILLENCQFDGDNQDCPAFVRKDDWCNEFDTLNYLSYKIHYSRCQLTNNNTLSLILDSMGMVTKKQRKDTLVIGFMRFTHVEKWASSAGRRSPFYNGWSPFYDLVCNLYYVRDTIVKADIFPCSGKEQKSPLIGKTNAQLMEMDEETYEAYVKTVYDVSTPHFKNIWKRFHKEY